MDNALLWKGISPDGKESFLFGTMHVRDLKAFGDIQKIKYCIDQVEVYYSELEMDSSGIEALAWHQLMPDNKTLKSYISPHHYTRLQRSIKKAFGVDIDQFENLYPLILANMLQTSVLNNNSEIILDYYLFDYARRTAKDMRYLESQKEQLAYFHRIPIQFQIKSLLSLGRQPAKAKKQLFDLLQDYADKNTRQLYQRSKRQLGGLRRMLLYDRNEAMALKLITELNEKSAFVAVGAAHLFGQKGILRLMKKEGYRWTAVNDEAF